MTKVEFCWRYVPKLAVKLSEILCCGSFNGLKLQNEIFHEPGTSPDQPLVPTHPIIRHLAGSSPGKPVAVPRAMNYWQANSCASRWRRGDWIWCCNSQWDVDGSTARGWTSWTGGNGWGTMIGLLAGESTPTQWRNESSCRWNEPQEPSCWRNESRAWRRRLR